MKLNGTRGVVRMMFAAVTLITAACGGSPTQPTSSAPATIAVAPPVVHAAPVITSLSIGPRIEADDEITIAANVQDPDTPVDQLTYQWSVDPASSPFSGSGRQVMWKAPRGQHTPDVYVFSVTVIDQYMSGDERRENKTSASLAVHYNDSHQETAGLALDFLKDYANYSEPPEQIVRNFSDQCPGKLAELQTIQRNRRDYQIVGGDFSIALTGLYDDRTVGEVIAPCTFRSISKATGRTETTAGTCTMTTVYENWRWMLCDSRFTTNTGPSALQLSRR